MATKTLAKPNLTQAVPFFSVADIEESLRFYVEGLAFEIGPKWVIEDKIRWCWLSRGDVAFMLQQFAIEGHDSWKPSCKVGEGVSICVMCKDAIALYHELKDRGVGVSRPFVGNGLWVISVTDPDGFRIDFESPADVPEGSEYQSIGTSANGDL